MNFCSQVVPDFNLGQDYDDDYRPRNKIHRRPITFPEVNCADIEMMLAELSNPSSDDKSNSKVRFLLSLPIAKGRRRALLSDNSILNSHVTMSFVLSVPCHKLRQPCSYFL